MNSLDEHELDYQHLPHETKELLINSSKRHAKVRAEQLLKRAETLAARIPSWNIFKRLRNLERKMDMPFIEESGLSQFIEDEVDRRLQANKPRKAVKK